MSCVRVLAFALALLAPVLGRAGDVAPKPDMPPAPAGVPAFTWTGIYFGALAGLGWGTTVHDLGISWRGLPSISGAGSFTQRTTMKPTGFVAGALAGFNYQFERAVLGVEADLSFSDAKASAYDLIESRLETLSTLRARLGYSFGPTLVYLTGGVAFGDPKVKDLLGLGLETKGRGTGWVAGSGVEHAFTSQVIGRVEYLYADFGKARHSVPFVVGTATGGQTESVSFNLSAVRAALAYKW